VNEVNFCGIFTGVVYVYGKNQNGEEASQVVMSCVDQVLDKSIPQELHSELASIFRVHEYSALEDSTNWTHETNETSNDANGLSRLAILTIIIASMLLLAIVYYFYIHLSERNYGNVDFSKEKSVHLFIEHEDESKLDDEFVDEDLDFESYQDSTGDDGVLS